MKMGEKEGDIRVGKTVSYIDALIYKRAARRLYSVTHFRLADLSRCEWSISFGLMTYLSQKRGPRHMIREILVRVE
jgi:hypothetical protein